MYTHIRASFTKFLDKISRARFTKFYPEISKLTARTDNGSQQSAVPSHDSNATRRANLVSLAALSLYVAFQGMFTLVPIKCDSAILIVDL